MTDDLGPAVCLSWVPAARSRGQAGEGTACALLEHRGKDALTPSGQKLLLYQSHWLLGGLFSPFWLETELAQRCKSPAFLWPFSRDA